MSESKDISLPPGIRDPSRRNLCNSMIRDKITINIYGHETNGEYTEMRVQLAPSGGSPLHYHLSYSEQLTCTSGTLGVVLNNDTLHFPPGETAIVPVNTKHRFFNDTQSNIEFLGKVVPAHEGFEKSIYIMYGLANDGYCDEKGVQSNFVHLALIAELGDLKWPGVMSWVGNRVMRAVAAYGRWSGEEERLLKKYWY